MSVFIELGVLVITKQAKSWVIVLASAAHILKKKKRWVITCRVASPWRCVAHIEEEFVLIKTCKKEEDESSGQ